MRVHARRRFLFAAVGFALGSAFLAAALGFLLANESVAGISVLIFGVLLQILGLAASGYAAVVLARGIPLSEVVRTSRLILLACAAAVLPAAALGTAAWLILLAGDRQYYLIPAFPAFWGPVSAAAALGLVYAARELASDRMAVLAAVGGGAVVAMALSAWGASLLDPFRAILSARFIGDLLIVAAGFATIAIAFHWDAWVVRAHRPT